MFFAAAIIAAMMISSCTKEKTGVVEDLSGKSYATFTFNVANTTRAISDFNVGGPGTPTGVAANDLGDIKIADGDLYILIFNNTTGALEYKNVVTGGKHTALLSTGTKKIFVLANIGTTGANHVQPKLVTVNPSTLAPSTAAITWDDLAVGTTTLTSFYAICFNAGTPQSFSINKTTATRTYTLRPLWTVVDSDHGLAMSNSNQYTYTLKPSITEAQANTATTTPALHTEETYNRFKVVLDYMGAKARLILDQSAINTKQTGVAEISGPRYALKNLAKYTSLVQNVVSGNPQSIYHNLFPFGTPGLTQASFDPHVDQALNVNEGGTNMGLIPAASKSTNPPFIFVAENTGSDLKRGQSSFYALNLIYKPANIVKAIVYQSVTGNVEFTTDTYDNCVSIMDASGTKYIYDADGLINKDGIKAQYFANFRLYADAAWMITYGKPTTDASYTQAAADALVSTGSGTTFKLIKAKQYTNASSWYRIDIGEGTKTATVDNIAYGVLRGHAYTCIVDDITGPGEPSEADLFKDPEDPVVSKTHINVTIEARGWIHVDEIVDVP